jgi:hypothetical protein
MYTPLPANDDAQPLFTSFLGAQFLSMIYKPSTPVSETPTRLQQFSMWSFKAIMQTTKVTLSGTKHEDPEYFVPFGDYGREDIFVVGDQEPLTRQRWKRIKKADAEECLRLPGSGIEIGDGEEWKQLEGAEELWCKTHRVFWEMKVWVRLT